MNTRFFLREHSDNTFVWVDITGNGLRLRTSTGILVTAKEWEKKTGKVKGNDMNAHSCNKKLSDIKNMVDGLPLIYFGDKILTSEALKYELLNVIAPHRVAPVKVEVKPEISNLLDATQYLIEINPLKYKGNTIKGLKTFYKRLLDHTKKYGKKSMAFDSIDYNFGEEFKTILWAKNYQINYVHKMCKYVKRVMSYAENKKWHTNLDYKKIECEKRDQVDTISLTEEELQLINNKKVLDKWKLGKDVFCFMGFTGLRVSDIKNVNPTIREGNLLNNLRVDKTGKPNPIYLRKEAAAILDRYKGQFPSIADQTINEIIKLVCSLLKPFQMKYEVVTTEGGVDHKQWVKKYTLISCHTARRTFASNAVSKGIPYHVIMVATGHKDLKSFMKYIRLEETEKKNLMLKEFDRVYGEKAA